jgi:imidazolonepropionase-like amidohydrolase
MKKNMFLTLLGFFLMLSPLFSQTRAVHGLHDNTPAVYALTNARVVVQPGRTIDNATLVVRNGLIEAVGRRVSIPDDAWVVDMAGKTIYPGFIDPWVETGFAAPVRQQERGMAGIPEEYAEMAREMMGRRQQPEGTPGAMHWNPQLRPWYDASEYFKADDNALAKLRAQGITMANVMPGWGIFRGQSALLSLGKGHTSDLMIRSGVSQGLSFNRSRELGGGYPTSLMGVIALMRQTWYDTQWYRQAWDIYRNNPSGVQRPEMNLALEALIPASQGQQPVFFETEDELAALRAANIAAEFGLNPWIMGSGFEYRRIDAISNINLPLVLPLNFPAVPDVDRPELALNISLEDLRHWDFAPENPGRLHQAGISFALTSHGLKDPADFLKNLRLAVRRGLPAEAALQALTTTPARMMGIENMAGTLEAGKKAHLLVADGDIFAEGTTLIEVWVDGSRFPINPEPTVVATGTWSAEADQLPAFELELRERNNRLSGTLKANGKEISLSQVAFDGHRVAMAFRGDSLDAKGIVRLSAAVSRYELYGLGEMPDGTLINWQARRLAPADPAPRRDEEKPVRMAEGPMRFPSMEYGISETPEQPRHLLIRNATIWTQGPEGILEGADMLVTEGRIARIGQNLQAPRNAQVVDANGRHVTPGLVDPHIHTSIPGGVNEVGNAIVPETRIHDVISGDNVWIYRLLAGGLTTANLLHGSANPIGGQDAVIKMRWGGLPHELVLQEAAPGLKLALGENVKGNTSRYPNTRMGTEQSIRDAFLAAIDYRTRMQEWERTRQGIPPRRNLQWEALLEVLDGERIVHAHAYRQDEIQMLIRLAEEFGFKIESFEHTVEGYKVAEILAAHGAAAIVWTDWSSFKMEAYDATIYNARQLLEQGVLTTLHSDNTQLATRMNWEAGKMMATGIDEITAMDLITINAAKVLGAGDAIGSLEPGKHADFVIWSGHPLSGFTHAEQTWVDGRKYFDREKDMELRQEVIRERAALIQKALEEKAARQDNRPGGSRPGNPNSSDSAQ